MKCLAKSSYPNTLSTHRKQIAVAEVAKTSEGVAKAGQNSQRVLLPNFDLASENS
ncbi:MAG: hypothetical protein JWN70_3881 [Planctomycetaceae bacterium]|nr:hypothetical protein [Planctomycetaceae bacterium]